MARNDAPWPTWRTKRLIDLLAFKALGKTDEQAGHALAKPISRGTTSRELNSPQAAELGREMRARAGGMVWALVERQIRQIEGDVATSPAQKLIYRGQLIQTLSGQIPKQIEQKVSGEIDQKVRMIDVTEEDLLDVVAPVVDELLARRARGIDEVLPEEN